MNPYDSPTTTCTNATISFVAVGVLTIGTVGLGFAAAVFCGFSCYLDIGGDSHDDLIAMLILFGVPLVAAAWIGIPAGVIHLRYRTKFAPIHASVYIVALTALIVSSLLSSPIIRWFSIFLICCATFIVLSIRTASRLQHGL